MIGFNRKYDLPGQLYMLAAVLAFLIFPNSLEAQYAPPAGQDGTTAIHRDSSVFVAWASQCEIERGYTDISMPDSGFVNYGEPADVPGLADDQVVSLGDGGMATLTFEVPIANGPGPDFAVFENSLWDDFLELAFVEVSSDGTNYFRFAAVSLTQTDQQVGSFGLLDATKLHNLAGKYRAAYGVPFDLEELDGNINLDVNHIFSIRIVDVIGSITDDFSTFDSMENKVNDPWPTPFPSGGFDLDAVGVIHNEENTGVSDQSTTAPLQVFPNPANNSIHILTEASPEKIIITDMHGNVLKTVSHPERNFNLDISSLPRGLLFIRYNSINITHSVKLIKL